MQVGGVELLVETAAVAGTEQTAARLDRAQEAVSEAGKAGGSAADGD